MEPRSPPPFRDRIEYLLCLGEDGGLDGDGVLELSMLLDDCAVVAIRITRERCFRYTAPAELRLRILQALPHRCGAAPPDSSSS
jgi:hypothetical protein